MTDLNKTIPTPAPVSPIREVAARADTDFDRWLSSGQRLLAQTRQRLATAEHNYAVGRARIIADAERELATFRQATRDKLADFQSEQQQLIGELRAEVERIEQMHDLGQQG